MTSTAKLWTLHGLSVELNRNTRTLAKALRTTRPDGKVGNYAGWYMSTALSALRRHEGPRDVGDSNVDAVCYDLEAVARAFDARLARMRKEQDIAKRRELAREVGPLIGRGAVFEDAQAAEERSDIATAERLYRRVMKMDPADPTAPSALEDSEDGSAEQGVE